MYSGPQRFDGDISNEQLLVSLNIPTKKGKRSGYRDWTVDGLLRSLKQKDESQFVSRFEWHNLPKGLTSDLLERVLYYRGSGILYFDSSQNQFFFLPYTLNNGTDGTASGIDMYGRWVNVSPQPFFGTSVVDKAKDTYLGLIVKRQIFDIPEMQEPETDEDLEALYKDFENNYLNGCVQCFDYTPGMSYSLPSRNNLNQEFIEQMCYTVLQLRQAVLNSTGFNMFAIQEPGQANLLQAQLDAITEDRYRGAVQGVVSSQLAEPQNLANSTPAQFREFLALYDKWNSLREDAMGVSSNQGNSNTKYESETEISMDASSTQMIYLNAFFERVKFASIANQIWGLNIFPDPSFMSGISAQMAIQNGLFQQDEYSSQNEEQRSQTPQSVPQSASSGAGGE